MQRIDVRARIARSISQTLSARGAGVGSMTTWGAHYFPEYFDQPFGRHHRKMAKRLKKWSRKRNIRAVIISPRDSAKSTILTFLDIMNDICHGLEKYILIIADTYSQAVKWLKGIRYELEENEALAEAYPHVCGKGKEWNDEGIITRNGIRIEPLGTGQKIRGRRERSERPTKIVIDDAEGDEAALSSVQRNSIRQWALKGAFKAGGPGTNIIVAGTVIHDDCLASYCSQLPGWHTLFFRALEEMPTRMDLWANWELILRDHTLSTEEADDEALAYYFKNRQLMDQGAKVLWPDRHSLYSLMYKRATEGHSSFESEYQNNPIDPSKCEWDPKLFDGEHLWFDEWPDDLICRVMALDPSKGRTDRPSDYQAIVSLGVARDLKLYVECDMSRRPLSQMVIEFIGQARIFDPDVAVCESEQFQELLLPEMEDEAIIQQLICPIEGITTGGVPKVTRIRRAGPYINRGRIRYKKRSPGTLLLMRQQMQFPNADHDDGPDALEMCIRRANELLSGGGDGNADSPY